MTKPTVGDFGRLGCQLALGGLVVVVAAALVLAALALLLGGD